MRKVIARTNLPARAPVITTALSWLLLDRLAPPGWVNGAVWMFVGLLWLSFAFNLADQHVVDLFKERK